MPDRIDEETDPTLTLLAGPNGAGKSSFTKFFRENGLIECPVVNIDALEIDESMLPYDPMRYFIERRKALHKIFRLLCEDAVKDRRDFSFECNLRYDQLINIDLFDEGRYKINLIFLWLNDVSISHKRVQKRVANNGHYVGKDSIERNYCEGLKNLDQHFRDWDSIYIFDNSTDFGTDLPIIFFISQGDVYLLSKKYDKEYLKAKFPNIMEEYCSKKANNITATIREELP